ncbi:sensor histidine kinase [Marinobacter sp.]|uniref:sensor histidine kinase n=1 Tax=Marinobacter sp. TaxID=50741 RepID=UPI003A940641
MTWLSGIDQVRQLSVDQKQGYERFYRSQSRLRVLPVFADVSLGITFIGTLIFLLGLALSPAEPGVTGTHLLYTAVLAALIAAHRFTRLRQMSPLIVYLVFFHMALFSYLGYILAGATLAPIVGLLLFMSSVGIITLSMAHTITILLMNLILLVAATALAVPAASFASTLTATLTNWLVLMCILIAPISAYFFRVFLRNLLALQFLLKDRNRALSRTLHTLKVTEGRLALEQKHQALSHMAKGLLHEIMNPLNCASQAVDYARAINRDSELSEALDDATLHQKRIADIVSDLIDFSRPEPDHSIDKADLGSLIDTALRFCKHQLRGTDVHLSLPANVSVPCYPSALTQVFVNLLLNAASALGKDKSRTSKRIDIRAVSENGSLEVSIQDNGHGIAPEDIKRLTDPFYSTSRTPDNLGLGLSICQTIIRHHQGHMDIRSELGEWTQVVLRLPSPTA